MVVAKTVTLPIRIPNSCTMLNVVSADFFTRLAMARDPSCLKRLYRDGGILSRSPLPLSPNLYENNVKAGRGATKNQKIYGPSDLQGQSYDGSVKLGRRKRDRRSAEKTKGRLWVTMWRSRVSLRNVGRCSWPRSGNGSMVLVNPPSPPLPPRAL